MNISNIQPDAPRDGFRAQVATLVAGLAAIRGTATDQANIAGAIATSLLGVVDLDQQSPAVAAPVTIRRWCPGRRAYAQAGAAVVVDALLTTDANGRFITASTGNKVLAIADSAAAVSGDVIAVIFQDGNLAAP
jgi:hypothetical protein